MNNNEERSLTDHSYSSKMLCSKLDESGAVFETFPSGITTERERGSHLEMECVHRDEGNGR